MFPESSAILFAYLFFISNVRKVCLVYKDATGNWKRDWLKPYLESLFNIIFSFLFASWWGVNGVLLSSIVSMCFVSIPWETYALDKGFFQTNYYEYFRPLTRIILLGITTCIVLRYILSFIDLTDISNFVTSCVMCVIFPTGIFLFMFRRNPHIKRTIGILKKDKGR